MELSRRSRKKLCKKTDRDTRNISIEKNNSSYLDNETIYFSNVLEAQDYGKRNPGIRIMRSPCGNGFIAKQ